MKTDPRNKNDIKMEGDIMYISKKKKTCVDKNRPAKIILGVTQER